MAIVGDFSDDVWGKKIRTIIAHRAEAMMNKGAYLVIVKSLKPTLSGNPLF
jgi:hypothetical protein